MQITTLMKEQPSPLSLYYITINNVENAQKLAAQLVEKKLIACANIIGNNENSITSIFSWKEKLETEKEILIILKSRTGLLKEIAAEVKKNHPYEVPEIIATPIYGGSESYIKWVFE